MEYMKRYEAWRESPDFDEETRAELAAIGDNPSEIQERFYQDLEFGTGGLRGILGAGTNRMNIYTVRRASQGLADYILTNTADGKARGVVVSHDSRRFSREFALETALIMVQNGIKAYVFKDLRPTPQLSFAIRHLKCISGVMITASHNPPEYNGYKAYWEDGSQFAHPQDADVISYVNKIEDFSKLVVANLDESLANGMLTILDETIDDEYMSAVMEQSLNADITRKIANNFNIVYTPLNGAGNIPVRRALSEAGFTNIYIVPEQEHPDPNFTTLAYPNPEDPAAFTLGVKLAKIKDADIIVATDPDADRMGAMVKNAGGEYELLSGNMAGILLAEYILSQKQKKGTLPKNAAIISTIVSTNITAEIAKAYNTAYCDVLTGFKHIAEKIRKWEKSGEHSFVYGFEESYGYLAGSAARDKDAIVATMLICEIAAYYKSKGMSIFDGLAEIYNKYGFFTEAIKSVTLKGMDGLAKIKSIMTGLRENLPESIGGVKLEEFRDYKSSVTKFISSGVIRPIDMPVSDVLYYVLEDGSWFCVRPSGTEPKIKIYMGTKGDCADTAVSRLKKLADAVYEFISID